MQRRFSDRYLNETTPLSPETFNPIIGEFDRAIAALEAFRIDWQEQVDLFNTNALKRFNDAVKPLVDRLQTAVQGGFLVAQTDDLVEIIEGAEASFLVPVEARAAYRPTPFVVIVAPDEREDWAIGRTLVYNEATGLLKVEILYLNGSGAERTGWTVAASSGVVEAVYQWMTEVSTMRDVVVAKALQVAEDAAAVLADKATVAAAADEAVAAAGTATDKAAIAMTSAEEASASAASLASVMFIASSFGTPGSSSAIAAAVASCAAAGGGKVYVPAGTWTISSKITVPSKVRIIGAGIDATRFVAANGLNDHMFTTPDTETLWEGTTEDGAQYWGIAECTIDGNKANQTSGCGIKTYSRAYNLKNIKIERCKEQGILSRWGDGPSYSDPDAINNDLFMEALIDNVFVQYCDKEGIHYDGPHDGRMTNCIVALNSHAVPGSYDGIYIGARAGGMMATQCHSWGNYQRYAWNIEAASTHFSNCEADDANIALIRINAPDCTWIGGTQIGGFINTPPSAGDKDLKGFVFGTGAYRPHIVTTVRNCPNGAIDFTNVGNLGGFINILGALDASLLTANTGQATYGFQGAIPSTFWINLDVKGTGNAFAINNMPSPQSFADGSVGFPSVRRAGDITTGIFFAVQKVGFSTAGVERMAVLNTKLDIAVPIEFAPGASVTPTNNGDVVFELTSNTQLKVKAKGSDGIVRTATLTLA